MAMQRNSQAAETGCTKKGSGQSRRQGAKAGKRGQPRVEFDGMVFPRVHVIIIDATNNIRLNKPGLRYRARQKVRYR